MAEKAEVTFNEFNVDVAVRTIRGRACPVCGGKIIPSNRAVYQSAGDPTEVYALWECERCGHSEKFEKPLESKKVHGAPAAKALPGGQERTAPPSVQAGTVGDATSPSAGTPVRVESGRKARAAARRAMPPDVKKMLEVMKRQERKVED